jgi:hypothetical protein
MSWSADKKDGNSAKHLIRCLLIILPAIFVTIPCSVYADVNVPDEVVDTFGKSCAFLGCHAGPGAPKNLDLTQEFAVSSLVAVPSSEKPQILRVNPGDAANSYLVMKLRGDPDIEGEQMPRGGKPLSEAEIAVIESWIESLPIGTESPKPEPPQAQAFAGWSLSNLPTTQTLETGSFLFRIAHRWRGRTKEGADQLFGLDHGAHVFIQLAFPIRDDLMVSLGRSSDKATHELAGKWRFLAEEKNGPIPISAAIVAGVDWLTLQAIIDPDKPSSGDFLSRTDAERFHWFAQLALSKRIHERVSLLLVPGILVNGNVSVSDEDPIFTLGYAGKIVIFDDFSLFVEGVPILSGEEGAATVEGWRVENGEQVFSDMFAAGLEYKIGGHVFHIYVTNSLGLATNQYMSGGKLDFAEGDFRLGFNIYRILRLPF